jgi:chorismate mutase/prephenate dehydratase
VVYQGEPGAYSEEAARNFFGPQVEAKGLRQFEDVFLAIQSGQADYGVLPIENNSTGAIRQVYDLLSQYEFYLVGETTVRVEHCLMAPKGATLDTITHVYSHEQGLFQSEPFLNEHPTWVKTPLEDTAGSAKYVAQTGDITKAAICSARSAEIYGLDILAHGVNYSSINTTRFVVVSPCMELRPGADKISTIVTTPHESGCLHEILTIFAVNGLNMVKLESRPIQGHSWEYMFFLEFTGNLAAPEMDGVLHELAQTAGELRVLGNFKSNLEQEA